MMAGRICAEVTVPAGEPETVAELPAEHARRSVQPSISVVKFCRLLMSAPV